MCFVLRLNATNEEILEETLEDNNDLIDVRTQTFYFMLIMFYYYLYIIYIQNAITVVNNLLIKTNTPGWDHQAQVHKSLLLNIPYYMHA